MKKLLTIITLLCITQTYAQSIDVYNKAREMNIKGKIKNVVSHRYWGTVPPDFKNIAETDNYDRCIYFFSPDGRLNFMGYTTIRKGKLNTEYTEITYKEDGTAKGYIYSMDTVLIREQEYKKLSSTSYELTEYDANTKAMIYKSTFYLDKYGRLLTEETKKYRSQSPYVYVVEKEYDSAGDLVSRLEGKKKMTDDSAPIDIITRKYEIEIRDDRGNPSRLIEHLSDIEEPITVINVNLYHDQ